MTVEPTGDRPESPGEATPPAPTPAPTGVEQPTQANEPVPGAPRYFFWATYRPPGTDAQLERTGQAAAIQAATTLEAKLRTDYGAKFRIERLLYIVDIGCEDEAECLALPPTVDTFTRDSKLRKEKIRIKKK